ncbi:hypothetical protein TNCV_2675711 [Trichonephila clavipes]|nr:hypothetical protein TNCV_2675711 [Trichonephila clavipes]
MSRGRGNLMVKITDSWQACHKFEPSIAEELSKLKYPPIGVLWKLGEEDASSGFVLVTGPWLKITKSVALVLLYSAMLI